MSYSISNGSFQLTENVVPTSEQRVGCPIHYPVNIAGLRMKTCCSKYLDITFCIVFS